MTDQPLTDEQLNAIEARANAATPPPWTAMLGSGEHVCTGITREAQTPEELNTLIADLMPDYFDQAGLAGDSQLPTILDGRLVDHRPNMDFIMAARDDVPRLVAEIRRLRALLIDGVMEIAEERQRQITVKGYTAEHDDMHVDGELARAAIAYSTHSLYGCLQEREQFGYSEALIIDTIAPWWPWGDEEFKPKEQTADLRRAGAFIAAEIARLKRRNNRGVDDDSTTD